jgi:hypothetical protein
MTEMDIVKILTNWVDYRKYPWQLATSFIYSWESDYWAMDEAGVTREFEIKISRADYLKDAKKDKHKECNGANYFYYVVPKDLIKPEEVDKKYGLIYIWEGGHVSIVKKPRQLNDNRFNNWKMLANKMYWKFRALWREKYLEKKITIEEYHAEFNLQLSEEETPLETSQPVNQ